MNPAITKWGVAKDVLKPETLQQVDPMRQATKSLLDSWAISNPTLLKTWEQDGSLLQRIKDAQNQAIEAEQRATEAHGGNPPPLSSWEIAELYGGPSSKLPT